MTDPDPRYAGGCVDWSRFEVPALAGFLDEDLDPGWAQVSAWRHAHDLTVEHLAVMRQARAAVVAAWPPSVNRAAAAYVDQLDGLLASMENMRVAAEANARALSGILTVLAEAKNTVDELHAQWKQQPSSWETTALTVAAVLTGDRATTATVQALDIYRASLNTKARAVMRATDQSAYEYLPQLVVVQPAASTRIHDPTTPGPATTGSGAGGSSARNGSLRRPTIPPPAPPAAGGPVLSGSTTSGQDPGVGADVGPPESGSVGPTPLPDAASPTRASPWVETPNGRALRAGAVLGAPPDVEIRTGSAQRVDGNGRALTESGAKSGQQEPGLWGSPAGAGRAASRRRQRILPADTEWPVAEGVPPVLEPGPEPVHDPGPGVIGIDR